MKVCGLFHDSGLDILCVCLACVSLLWPVWTKVRYRDKHGNVVVNFLQ